MAAGDISKDLLAQVRYRIGEPAADKWSDDEIYAYLNDGQMTLAHEEVLDAALLPLTEIRNGIWTAGTSLYQLPTDFLRERYVTVGGVPARRIEMLDLGALTDNSFYDASKTNPFYSIQRGQLQFHTGGQDPTSLVYKLYYVRKPMWVRRVEMMGSAPANDIYFASDHGLTSDNAGEILRYEDGRTEPGGLSRQGDVTLAAYTSDAVYSVTSLGTLAGAAGGKCVHTTRGQISSTEDPLLEELFHGLIMDYAVMRCREQAFEWNEAGRQKQHFQQRLEAMKQRYGTGRPHDNIAGDPGKRVPANGG